MIPAARALAEWADGLRAEDVPAAVRDNARTLPPDRVAVLERTVLDLERVVDMGAVTALCRIG